MSISAENGSAVRSLGDWCPPGYGLSSDKTPLTPQLELTAASDGVESGRPDVNPGGQALASCNLNTDRSSRTSQTNVYRRRNVGCRRQNPTGRRKWSKADNKVALECFYQAEAIGGRGVSGRTFELWKAKGMFDIRQNGLMGQIRTIRRKNWFTLVEVDEIRHAAERRAQRQSSHTESEEESIIVEDLEDNAELNERTGSVNNENSSDDISSAPSPHIVDIPIELEDEEMEILNRLTEMVVCEETRDPINLRYVDRKKLQSETKKVNNVLRYVTTDNITEVRDLICSAATLVGERVGAKRRERKKSEEPWWKRRIEGDIKSLRKHVAQIESWSNGKWKNAKSYEKEILERKYKIKVKGFQVVIEELKQRISSKAVKIRRYSERISQFEQNRLFNTNQKQFFRNLDGDTGESLPPNPDEAIAFWSDLWSKPVTHNSDAEWLNRVKAELVNVPAQECVSVSKDDVKKQINGLPNWKAPGPDRIQGFWLKRFLSMHGSLTLHLNECVQQGSVPSWMVEGRTTLLMKDKSKGAEVTNYRPIACLNLLWKILTGIFADKVYTHLDDNDILPLEQKGCRKKSQGTKDHLAIDKAVLRNCRRRQTNLCMGWIDFKKAYDMVPHSWIVEVMDILNIAVNIKSLLTTSMTAWKTTLVANNQTLGNVDINRGIFQGDSFSPLLFVMALIPLTMVLRSTQMGYKMDKEGPELNHLLFMDDLKLFAKKENEIDSLVQTVNVCSKDIGMEFGISKCAVVTMHRGKKVACTGVELPNGERLADPEDTGYKYLGILEIDDILVKEMKSKVRNTYLDRLTKTLKSRLSSKNLVCAVNTWAVAVVRYSAAIIDWTVEEIDKLDRETRKLLLEHKFLHPRADTTRLYIKRKNGGRGLISIEDCVAGEKRSLDYYLANSEEILLRHVADKNGLDKATIESKDAYKTRIDQEKIQSWKNMPLHGKFEQDTQDLKTTDSWTWLTRGDLKRETESLLIAAQDQALATNAIKKSIYKTTDNDKCRLCGLKVESVTHIISACKMLAQREYKCRHDKVCKYLHWHLCNVHGFDANDKWYLHKAEKVLENENTKILWDFNCQTDREIHHRKPDIILINKETNDCFIIDVAIPGDHRVALKEVEKITNYSELRVELERMWGMNTKVIPVVVGALGSIPFKLSYFLDQLKINYDIGTIQKTAVLGSAHILRKVLSV